MGFIMRCDMKTWFNKAYLTAKAYKRMLSLRRLKALGASTSQLLDVLDKQVLPVLWLGAPAWYCQLTEAEKRDFDRIEKVALRIIYGNSYSGFEDALQRSQRVKPTVRMLNMTRKVATKSLRNSKFSQWFQPLPETNIDTRTRKLKLSRVKTRTERYYNSRIPYMTRIINEAK